MAIFKKITVIASYILLISLICVFAFYFVFNLVAPHETTKVFGFKAYRVLTDSMEPTIKVGDTVVVKKVKPDQIAVDDVITFKRNINGQVRAVTHYCDEIIVDPVEGHTFRTRPESKKEGIKAPQDPWLIYEKDLIGRVSKVHSKASFVGFILSPFFILAILIIILIVWIATTIIANHLHKNKQTIYDGNNSQTLEKKQSKKETDE